MTPLEALMAIVDFLQCLSMKFLWDHNTVTEEKEVVDDSKFVTYLPIYNTIWANSMSIWPSLFAVSDN